MDDLTGHSISHYTSLEKIGAGGMGVVYKARDHKLNRTVALKFLHPHTISDPEKRDRFWLEAQAAAALNHPNICTIYEIDETTTANRQFFMALEYVDGETLEQKIAAGSLPIAAILEIAIQITEGLAEAHAKGVVHRDIKSANIMVTHTGQVKIMDFGLAKFTTGMKIGPDGKTLGTLAYLSPEQARDVDVDHRTDIWSLGVLLYEMLTGQLPFEGENEVALLLAILNNEPKSISTWRREVPSELEKIIFQCLAKEKENRCRSANQLLLALKELQPTIDSPCARTQSVAPSRKPGRSPKTAKFILAGILLIAIIALISHLNLLPRKITTPRIAKISNLSRTIDIFEAGMHISPDGARIAYNSDESGNLDLWVLQIASGQRRNLTQDHHGFDSGGKWSPDGNWLAFTSSRDGGGIFIVSEYGGAARQVVASDPKDLGRVCWSPDGSKLAYTVKDTLFTVPAQGGIPRRVPLAHDCGDPDWSPDGNRIVYITGRSVDRQIWTVQPDGSEPLAVVAKPGRYLAPAWSPDGKRIWFKNIVNEIRELWWLPVDRKGKPRASAIPLQAGVNFFEFSISQDGSKIVFLGGYEGADRNFNIWSIPVNSDQAHSLETAVQITADVQDMGHLAMSSDHEWFAYTSPRAGLWDIWLVRRNGTELRQLTADSTYEGALSWSPDGSQIAFHGPRPFVGNIYLMPVKGGAATPLIARPNRGYFPAWSPDGEEIAYNSDQNGNWDVWVVSVTSGKVRQLTNNPADEAFPCWSPDGRTIAFASNQSGAGEIHLIPAKCGAAKQLTHSMHSIEAMRPTWSPDGKTIYTNYDPGQDDPGRKIAAVSVADGSVRKIFVSKKPYIQCPANEFPSLVTDGKMLYFIAAYFSGDIMLADLVYE